MSRLLSVLAALVLFALGALLVLYGLFAILYRGDSGGSGDTYVTFFGHEYDADLIGAVSLFVGGVVIVFGVVLVRLR